MIPGKRIVFSDGVARIVPSFTFRQRRELDEDAEVTAGLASANPRERAAAIFVVAHRALVRNYPDLKAEDMEGILEPGLIAPVVEAVLGVVSAEERTTGETPGQ